MQKPASGNGQSAISNLETQNQAAGNRPPATGNVPEHEIHPSIEMNERFALKKGSDLAQRTIRFAAEVLRIAKSVPKDVGGRHVVSQLIRSATSIGANYEEARAAERRSDFIHKLGVALKEARETRFWLGLIVEAQLVSDRRRLALVVRETDELNAILGASIRTARDRR